MQNKFAAVFDVYGKTFDILLTLKYCTEIIDIPCYSTICIYIFALEHLYTHSDSSFDLCTKSASYYWPDL
jgi:hypothetical protein